MGSKTFHRSFISSFIPSLSYCHPKPFHAPRSFAASHTSTAISGTATTNLKKRSMATIANFQVPTINNEPNNHYTKGSQDRQQLAAALEALQSKVPLEVPLVVDGKEVSGYDIPTPHVYWSVDDPIRRVLLAVITDSVQIRGSSVLTQNNPSSHADPIAKYSNASPAEVTSAIDSALKAKDAWESLPFADRAAVCTWSQRLLISLE